MVDVFCCLVVVVDVGWAVADVFTNHNVEHNDAQHEDTVSKTTQQQRHDSKHS